MSTGLLDNTIANDHLHIDFGASATHYALCIFLVSFSQFVFVLWKTQQALSVFTYSATFLHVNLKLIKVWKGHLYELVSSYETKPLLSPPFSMLTNVYDIIEYLTNKCLGRNVLNNRKLSILFNKNVLSYESNMIKYDLFFLFFA